MTADIGRQRLGGCGQKTEQEAGEEYAGPERIVSGLLLPHMRV